MPAGEGRRVRRYPHPLHLGVRTSYSPTFFGYDVSSGVDCRIGAYGFIDQQTMLGHDVVIGDYGTSARAACWLAT